MNVEMNARRCQICSRVEDRIAIAKSALAHAARSAICLKCEDVHAARSAICLKSVENTSSACGKFARLACSCCCMLLFLLLVSLPPHLESQRFVFTMTSFWFRSLRQCILGSHDVSGSMEHFDALVCRLHASFLMQLLSAPKIL